MTPRRRARSESRQRFFSIFSSRDKRKLITKVNASNDLSFEIRKGEAVALLGHNGAGKSTALKMITGVTFPTKGEVIVNGTVSALLELTAGFDMALTGRENIHLRGHAMGLDADEIAAREPKVVESADLGLHIDQPVRTYSSGMKSRLGFAFAVSSDPEILVVDEALSVGDKQFLADIFGCYNRLNDFRENVAMYSGRKQDAQNHLFVNTPGFSLAPMGTYGSWKIIFEDPLCAAFIGTSAYFFGGGDYFGHMIRAVDDVIASINKKYRFERQGVQK